MKRRLENDNLIRIYAYIFPHEETWQHQFFNLINSSAFAPYISSIEIKGPDMGTNGTRLFDLSEMLKDPDTQFFNLVEFEVEQTSPLHHNITMVSYDDFYDENGAAGRILDKMPNLKSLILPSAPSPNFFQRDSHPLEFLSLQAGYDHQGFLSRLAHSTCFPQLKHLEWTDGPGLPIITSYVPQEHIRTIRNQSKFHLDIQETNLPSNRG